MSLPAALYLQVSIVSQALIFVTRSRSWSFIERPGLLLVSAFIAAQLVATAIAVYASWSFARIQGIGWGWAGAIWIFSVVTYFPLDVLKFIIRYALSGKAWDNMIQNKTAFTTKKDYGRGEREAQWVLAERTLHGLKTPDCAGLLNDKSSYRELSEIAEQAKRRAEVARSEATLASTFLEQRQYLQVTLCLAYHAARFLKEPLNRFWAHVVMAYAFTFWTCYVLVKEYATVTSMRLQVLALERRRPDQFTLV
ncbi:hypothetical protein F0562_030297 [Nyssa sinensis]|uniref:Uncharacterized protein n=1 Tax=Nyssa sinensis TaxID=561372 RepID=A0A5J5AY03_9ASTE|nr:hypothetical protein F0562_030297 [Nyssa sinensis]